MNNKQIIIYTDGSSLGNPGKGGWATILTTLGKILELSGGYRMTTNNRMELTAIIKGLEALKEPCNNITIFTDSQFITNSINKGWLDNWTKNGWKKSNKKDVLNIDLWQKFIPLWQKHNIKFIWIEGHIGIPNNERCDFLCRQAAENAVDIDFGYENLMSYKKV